MSALALGLLLRLGPVGGGLLERIPADGIQLHVSICPAAESAGRAPRAGRAAPWPLRAVARDMPKRRRGGHEGRILICA